jgi:hypothetical protein
MTAVPRFLYYAATTLSGYQTLGEEYSGLIQIVAAATGRVRTPSLPRRFLMVFLQTFGPRILAAALARAEKHLNDEKLSLGRLRTVSRASVPPEYIILDSFNCG